MTKICSKCGIEKDEGEFYFRKENNSYRKDCKECCADRNKKYHEEHKEEAKKYREEHEEEIKKWRKQYTQEHKEDNHNYYLLYKEQHKQLMKRWYEEHKEELRDYRKRYHEENKEEINAKSRQYYQKNKDKKREYTINNREKINERNCSRRVREPRFRLRENISRAINHGLKKSEGSKKGISYETKLSYTIEQLKEHLEKQFEPWMNWNNYGVYKEGDSRKWHIDHIIPHSHFHYSTMDCEDFRQCWALSNLRPLEAIENIRKYNKILDNFHDNGMNA